MDDKITKRLHVISHLESYEVFEHELTMLETGQSSHQNDLTFFSITVTVFLCFLTVWLTLPVPPNVANALTVMPLTRAEQYYFLAMVASGGLSVFFFFRWRQSSKMAATVCQMIRQRSVGTVGEQGKEIKPSELANMTPQPEPSGEGEAK